MLTYVLFVFGFKFILRYLYFPILSNFVYCRVTHEDMSLFNRGAMQLGFFPSSDLFLSCLVFRIRIQPNSFMNMFHN